MSFEHVVDDGNGMGAVRSLKKELMLIWKRRNMGVVHGLVLWEQCGKIWNGDAILQSI